MSVEVSPFKSFGLWAMVQVSDWRNGYLYKQQTGPNQITYSYRNDMSCLEVTVKRIIAEPAFLGLTVISLIETAVRGVFGLIAMGVHHCLPPGDTEKWLNEKVIAYTTDMTLVCTLSIIANAIYALFNPLATHVQYTHDEDLSCPWSCNTNYSLT